MFSFGFQKAFYRAMCISACNTQGHDNRPLSLQSQSLSAVITSCDPPLRTLTVPESGRQILVPSLA